MNNTGDAGVLGPKPEKAEEFIPKVTYELELTKTLPL
jgi:hypothetical protein